MEKRILVKDKTNILVTNFNVTLTGCLLIEILELISQQFEQLKVRTEQIRAEVEKRVAEYMMQVDGEEEMRYLLLEKDFEDRDALDLITTLNIVSFLECRFAENVVFEIWRSPYATNDLIFTASTNYYFLFDWYDCIIDQETSRRFFAGKHIKNIPNHPM